MPKLGGGNTERFIIKLKKSNELLKPKPEPGPKLFGVRVDYILLQLRTSNKAKKEPVTSADYAKLHLGLQSVLRCAGRVGSSPAEKRYVVDG